MEYPEEELMEDRIPIPAEEGTVEKLIEKTPWWAISVGAHTIAILILSFIIVLGNPFVDAEAG